MTEPNVHIKWASEVAAHDYAAAEAYLSLNLGNDAVSKAVERLREAPSPPVAPTTSSVPPGSLRRRSMTQA